MGRADNRRTKKMKQRRAQRKLKARAKKLADLVRTERKTGKRGPAASASKPAIRRAQT